MRPTKTRVTAFGLLLETERKKQGLNGKELAHLAGISSGYLSQLETGAKNPTPKVIRSISGALDIHSNTLLSAARILVMHLERALQNQQEAVLFSVEVDAEERDELVTYLSFLRFRASVGHAEFTISK